MKRSVNFGGKKRWRKGFKADHLLATLDWLTDNDKKKKEILESMKKDKSTIPEPNNESPQ